MSMEKERVILIVDDSKTTRKLIAGALENQEYKLLQATNGVEGINSIQSNNVDLMILDLLMPEMDGIEVIQKLKELKIDIPVIILTADIQDEVKNECYNYGVKAFLNKPVKEKEIQDAVIKQLKLLK